MMDSESVISDGPRYVASLQDVKDKCCYKDFHESDKQGETIAIAEAEAKKKNRAVLVFDRKEHMVIHRFQPEVKAVSQETEKEQKKGKIIRKFLN